MLQEEVRKINANLLNLENHKIERCKVQSWARWRLYGDKLSAEFFKIVRETPQTPQLRNSRIAKGSSNMKEMT